MSERAYDIWVYDQERPNEKCFSEGRLNFPKPTFLLPKPEKIDQQERDRRNDEFLKQHGV